MLTTTLSSKGQVIIPSALRVAHHWEAGTEFVIVDTRDGVLLKPRQPFPTTYLEDGLGCAGYALRGGNCPDWIVPSGMQCKAQIAPRGDSHASNLQRGSALAGGNQTGQFPPRKAYMGPAKSLEEISTGNSFATPRSHA